MCPSGVTCLSADCCFSELALKKSTKRVDLVQSGSHHDFINKIAELTLNSNHSLPHSMTPSLTQKWIMKKTMAHRVGNIGPGLYLEHL